jgi:hypothetical protein
VSPHREQVSTIAATSPAWQEVDGRQAPPSVRDNPGQRRRRLASPATTVVAAVACLLSLLAYLHFYPGGQTIAYGDAKSHLLLARRVFFADTPGAGQLGGVWLPLPHILMQPLIWNNWAYYSGFAGSVVMMLCYVCCTLFVYKFTWRLTGRYSAAMAAAAVFALNPNILYMQSTPMTELLMFVTMMGSVYGLLCWIQTDENHQYHHLYLLGAGLSALLCALTRYEGWTLAVALTGIVLYCSLDKMGMLGRLLVTGVLAGGVVFAGWGVVHIGLWTAFVILPVLFAGYLAIKRFYACNDWHATEGQVLAFGILGAAAPLAWMIWNWVIFGSPLAFQNGTYAKPSNWVAVGERTVHNLWISLRTYEIATVDNITAPVAVLAVLGLVVYLWRTRLSRESLPVLSLLIMFPMFVVTLYKGQRPLHVYEFYYNYYNVRFGLVMLLPACLIVGYLVASAAEVIPARWKAFSRALPAVAVVLAVAVTAGTALRTSNIVTLQEPTAAGQTPTAQHAKAAADWFRQHYTSGLVLMESYGNESVSFGSHIPLEDQVYEGSYRIWAPALSNPSGHGIFWIVMRDETAHHDQVYTALYGSTLIDGYRLVWRNHDYLVYKWRGTAAQLAAAEQR